MNTSRCRIVIQARLSSARLPGKSLLPLKGIPIAVLCALRAANSNGEVVVATSTEPGDDLLSSGLSEYGVKVVRGPLNDVLERMTVATADLVAADLVVRLTADNVLPDGEFIDTLVRAFRSANVDYLGTRSPADGLPYGLSAEVFTVRILREAAATARTTEDREHVTPWIRSHGVAQYADRSMFDLGRRYDHLRCTIDTLDDYIRLAKLFDTVNVDPIQVRWRALIEGLAGLPGTPQFRIPYREGPNGRPCGVLSIGTAQLGMRYGIANRTGQPSHEEGARIIRAAVDHGVTLIDTARAYGDAESRIGAALVPGYIGRATVETKLDPLMSLTDRASEAEVTGAVDASVFRSCRELRTQHLDVLLLHRWAHRRQFRETVWRRLLKLQDEGVVGSLGASVYSPSEAIEALSNPEIMHLQLPYNVLDWRWDAKDFLEARRQRPDVSVHTRSVYLQGILVSEASTWPSGFVDADDWLGRIDRVVLELGRASRADLCMAYSTGADWVTTVLIGVETEQQLHENMALSLRPPLISSERAFLQETLGGVPERLLNPAMWAA